MTTLLHIDASPRGERSLSRRLSRQFVDAWLTQRPDDAVIVRDVGRQPPPFIDEQWIGGAFTAPAQRTAAQQAALRASDELIDELAAADVIVLGVPMHNYGMPAALKAWLDNVMRIDRTFTFDLARGDYPIEPILGGKTLVVLSSRGEFGFAPGGARAGKNQLDPHLQSVAPYLGVTDSHLIAIEYQEFRDARHETSVAQAHAAVPALVTSLQQSMFAPTNAVATIRYPHYVNALNPYL
ncbi:MAG TPA: NAD(P)H-dependent oxidoreductase [Tahibacter sp.]|nr:NAD(P)H-dependent oxidoreductase [Tahibacter sp.]